MRFYDRPVWLDRVVMRNRRGARYAAEIRRVPTTGRAEIPAKALRQAYWLPVACGEGFVLQANDDDPGGGFGWMPKDIRKVAIERDEYSVLSAGDRQNPIVVRAGELLVAGERGVVAVLAENDAHRVWNVLVQLDARHGYAAEIGTIRSRASSAAYASAAAMASLGNVG